MRQLSIRTPLMGLTMTLLVLVQPPLPATAAQATAERWSVVVSTAPHLPQDVWFAAMGNNTEGWQGGGSICINHLAQGVVGGEQVTFLVEVVEGGLFGVDGTPVAAGTYTFPGPVLGDIDYTVTVGQTYYVILDAYVVQSKLPAFPVGATLRSMYMWDFALGRTDQQMVLWADFGFGFIPFLNEGILMANVRLHP